MDEVGASALARGVVESNLQVIDVRGYGIGEDGIRNIMEMSFLELDVFSFLNVPIKSRLSHDIWIQEDIRLVSLRNPKTCFITILWSTCYTILFASTYLISHLNGDGRMFAVEVILNFKKVEHSNKIHVQKLHALFS